MTGLLEPGAIGEIVAGYKLAAALHAAVALDIPTLLAQGPLPADELAARAGVSGPELERLLRFLVSRGALALDADGYANSGLTSFLADGEARAMFLGWQVLPAFLAAWGGLADALRAGTSPFAAVHGTGLHDYFVAHPAAASAYDAAMGSTVESFQVLADALDVPPGAHVVCVGGASGVELVPILTGRPDLTGVLTDLPDALTGAPAVLAQYRLADRVTLVAGDARRTVPDGDVYVLSTVLRCLPDADVVDVLAACRRAARRGATLFAIEMPLPEGPPEHPGAAADLTAWVVYGGADRTLARWAELFAEAGWPAMQSRELEGPYALLYATT